MGQAADKSSRAGILSGTLRNKILAFVCALIVLSLAGSTVSLYRITEVNRILDSMNRVSVPMGRLFTQVQSDAELLKRELERNLGSAHWSDAHWKARPLPRWISEVLENEVTRIGELIRTDSNWAAPETRAHWQEWSAGITQGLADIRSDSARLHAALEQQDQAAAAELHSRLAVHFEEWKRQLQWGAHEYERSFRQTFSLAQSRVSELRTGLEMILSVVVALSLLLLWLGERALRPLGELTRLAREITRRGLRKGDSALIPELSLARDDEVSQLGREFHRMAAALLEREKMVESQKSRLEEQNRQLREMGTLNESVLNSIESVLIVLDLEGRIARLNPVARHWLGAADAATVVGTELDAWPMLRAIRLSDAQSHGEAGAPWPGELSEPRRIEAVRIASRVYGGYVYPLKRGPQEPGASGAILVLDDLTEDLDLQDRLRRAENLAAIGRMSAQVAHEVRNPLHSIGLEADMAYEAAARLGSAPLKQSLQSILNSVDRLEKITENYLKLSRLSSGQKGVVDLGDVLEAVLATYAPACEAQGVRVDWKRETRAPLLVHGDRDLLEQVLGNLFRNALQALEGTSAPEVRPEIRPEIRWSLGNAESGKVYVSIEDNGPGIPEDIRHRLFTPFVTSRAQGTGLGLSFVKRVIEEHGGRIEWDDTRASHGLAGTRFAISLPGVESAMRAEAAVASAAGLPESERTLS